MDYRIVWDHVLAIAGHVGATATSVEIFGYLAALVTITTYSMKTMIPLRIAGICANCLFITWGYLTPVYPPLVLHAILLPLNALRLVQMLRLVSKVRDAADSDLSMDWIKGFTHARECKAGDKIFAKGDVADAIYYPVSGRYQLVEIGLPIEPGQIVGEIGLASPGNRRTQSFVCTEDGELLVLNYSQVRQLYFQNPRFGFFFLKLVTQRLLANYQQLEDRLAQNAAPAAGVAAKAQPGRNGPA